ncbi:hypothetical protein M513_10746 [Trichuris suis]|uniref:Uncharacterized protein n=1 Tax=Trichuris suis TaxID=68888 RepID=A0A085LTU8_9BILA|nr:hypothetical protein M513_10746 [Trichuris suis]
MTVKKANDTNKPLRYFNSRIIASKSRAFILKAERRFTNCNEQRDIAKDALKIGCFCLGIASLMIIPFCAFKHHRGQKRHRSKSAASGDILETIVIGPPPPIPEDFPSPPPVRIYHKPIPFIPSEIEEKHEPLSLSLPDDE